MKRYYFLGLVLIFVSASFLSSCVEQEAHADGLKTEPALVKKNVVTQKVVPTTLTEYISANGITKAIKETTYSAEIAGRIDLLSADLGDRVKKGEVLARIDRASLSAQAEQAQAGYNLANATYTRISELKSDDLVSQQQIDEASANKIGSEAQLTAAQVNLSKSVVRAKHDGVVSRKYMELGEFAGPGSTLYTVVDYSTVIVEARLAESQIQGVVKGARVKIEVGSMNEVFEGEVETLLPTADTMSKTFTLRVKVPNPDEKILVGMSAKVKIKKEVYENAVAVSQSSVVEERDNKYAFVVENGTAVKRSITTGATEGDKVAILEGLSSGDEIVVLGQRDLTDGQPVNIVE